MFREAKLIVSGVHLVGGIHSTCMHGRHPRNPPRFFPHPWKISPKRRIRPTDPRKILVDAKDFSGKKGGRGG